MKGAISISFKEMILSKYGLPKWQEILKNAGFDKEPVMTLLSDMDDAQIINIMNSAVKVLGITKQKLYDDFGIYWVTTFAPQKYAFHYRDVNNAKDFLLKMDKVHDIVTKNISNAKPPRFTYEWKNDKTLLMTYNSSRGLIDLFVGLVKGVGEYYKTQLKVNKLNNKQVEIIFP